MAYDGSLIFDTGIDTKGFVKGVNTLKGQANSLSGTFAKLGVSIGTAFAVKKVFDLGKQAVSLASDLQEVQNVVDVSFGEMAYKMEEFSQRAIDAFGLSQLEAKRTGSSFMAMAKGMNFATGEASDMALSLTALSADMASFYNMSQSEARTALSSIYTGETETLKRYGILITEVNLQEYARQRGITKSINAMTQQEKVLLRYNYVMNATKLAQGDFARTSDSWANQTRMLSENWKELCTTLGNILIPILVKAIPYVTAFVRILGDGIRAIAQLWGIDLPDYSNTSKGIKGIDTGLQGVSTGAKKAKKELQNLAGFDELNIIGKKASEAGEDVGSVGGAGGIGGSDIGLDIPTYDVDKIKKQSDEIYKNMKGWIDGVAEKLRELMPLIETVGATLLTLWAINKIADFIGWVGKAVKAIGGLKLIKGIGKLFNAFLLGFDTAFGAGAGVFKSMTAGAKAFKAALTPLAKIMITVGASVASFFIAKGLFQDVAEGTRTWGNALAIAIPLVGGLAVAVGWLVSPIAGVAVALVAVVGAFIGYTEGANNLARQNIASYFQQGSTSVSELTTGIATLTEEMTATEEKFLTSTQSLNDNRTNAIALGDEITLLTADIRTMGGASQEEAAKLRNAFATLAEETKNYVAQANDNLKLYVLANKELLESQGVNVNQMISDLNKGADNTINRIDELEAKVDRINAKPIKTEADLLELDQANAELLMYQQVTVDTKSEVEKLKSSLSSYDGIKFGSSAGAEEAITSIGESAEKALQAIEKTRENASKTIDTLRLPEETKQRLRDELASSFTVSENEIKSAVAPTLQSVVKQYDLLVAKSDAQIKQARTQGFNPIVDLFCGYDNSVKKEMEKTGVKATNDILESAKLNLANNNMNSKIIDELLAFDTSKAKPKGEEIGKNIVAGQQKGITDNTGLATSAIQGTSDQVITTAQNAFGIHSPSTVFAEFGLFLMQGLGNGISDNITIAINTLDILFGKMMSKLDSFEAQFMAKINRMFQDVANTANSLSISADGKATVATARLITAPIPKLATGTVVPANYGEFLAVLGDNKRETEVVSPLSTIEKAVENAMSRSGGQGGEYVIHTHVYLNDNEIGESVERYNSRQLVRSNGRGR